MNQQTVINVIEAARAVVLSLQDAGLARDARELREVLEAYDKEVADDKHRKDLRGKRK